MASLISDAPVPIQPTPYAPPAKHVPPVQNDCFTGGAQTTGNLIKELVKCSRGRVEIFTATSKESI